MTESENVDQFMTRVMGIVNQIRLTGEVITDQRIVEKVFKSLPKKFKMVVTAILESKDLSRFSIDELIGSLVTHETKLHLTDESITNAFKTQFSLAAEEEAEVTKDEGVLQVTNTQVEVTDNNTRIRLSSLKEVEGEDQMTNQAYNAITAKSMGTMNLNAGRSK
jgi:hypothetical protein